LHLVEGAVNQTGIICKDPGSEGCLFGQFKVHCPFVLFQPPCECENQEHIFQGSKKEPCYLQRKCKEAIAGSCALTDGVDGLYPDIFGTAKKQFGCTKVPQFCPGPHSRGICKVRRAAKFAFYIVL